MIEVAKFHFMEATDTLPSVEQPFITTEQHEYENAPTTDRSRWFGQVLRFGLVGGLNTFVDVAILNGLLWLFPTTSTPTLLAYSALAFSLGAINSFLLNKYWTFKHKQRTTTQEVTRFAIATLFGIGWNTLVLWLASAVLHPLVINPTIWVNASKGVAIVSGALLSYLGMRLWVFVRPTHTQEHLQYAFTHKGNETSVEQIDGLEQRGIVQKGEDTCLSIHSLSVILPIYNEEDALATTIAEVLDTLQTSVTDFEIVAVNDGSNDNTEEILADLATTIPQLRVVTHERNQGYGTTLVDGFAAATKELTLFMDADGQFDIKDLPRLLAFIDNYDAVIGYRIHRQDTWMRKLNAWGWKTLVGMLLGVHVRDIDCAFKLLRTEFLHQYALQTRGAMINAELLYTLKHAGYTYREVGVHHLPRRGGRATGANPRVIARAFHELFLYTAKLPRETAVRVTASLLKFISNSILVRRDICFS